MNNILDNLWAKKMDRDATSTIKGGAKGKCGEGKCGGDKNN